MLRLAAVFSFVAIAFTACMVDSPSNSAQQHEEGGAGLDAELRTISEAQLDSLPEWRVLSETVIVSGTSDSVQYVLNTAGVPWTLKSGRIVVSSDQSELRYYSSTGRYEKTVVGTDRDLRSIRSCGACSPLEATR